MKIGVIATNATINNKIFNKNINKDIKEVACSMFVLLIENNNLDKLIHYFDLYFSKLDNKIINNINVVINDKINSINLKYLK